MRSRLGLIIGVLVGVNMVSQPIIDSTNFTPLKNEAFEYYNSNFNGLDYRSSGPSYSWNYSSAPQLSMDTIVYDSVDANNCFYNYPSFVGRPFTHGLINLSSSSSGNYDTDFKRYASSGLWESGSTKCSGYISDYEYIHFPFPLSIATNYSVTQTTTNYNIAPPSTTYGGWYRTLIADGYGTLSLPNSVVYNNCLRLKESLIDTIFTPFFQVIYDTNYFWLAPGIHHPVLEVQGATNAYHVKPIGILNSIKNLDLNQRTVEVYPNPANSITNVVSHSEGIINIYNVQGDLLFTASISDRVVIDVSNFKNGLYCISFISTAGTFTRKLLVER